VEIRAEFKEKKTEYAVACEGECGWFTSDSTVVERITISVAVHIVALGHFLFYY
jgi:hypothetical protein